MERSDLEEFLASSSTEGQADSQGVFTIDAHAALRKLAEYQLPYPGAWAVKIIQSIVAGSQPDEGREIRVHFRGNDACFTFPEANYTIEELAVAFYNPEPSANRSLRHLLSGLWPIAVTLGWKFQVTVPGDHQVLSWDGEQFTPRTKRPEGTLLAPASITVVMPSDAWSWALGPPRAADHNALAAGALRSRCCSCPLPLVVNGRRYDSLRQSLSHGGSYGAFPLDIIFAEASLPKFPLSRATFAEVSRKSQATDFFHDDGDGGGWAYIGLKRLQTLRVQKESALAFVLCVRMHTVETGKSSQWVDASGPSTFYWVSDGAVICQEPLLEGDSFCTVGCFLSAEGLATDLTSFQLLDSPERARRKAVARQACLSALDTVGGDRFDEVANRRWLLKIVGGGTPVALGLACLGFGLGWGLLGGFVGTIAGMPIFLTSGARGQGRDRSFRNGMTDLKKRLGAAVEGQS